MARAAADSNITVLQQHLQRLFHKGLQEDDVQSTDMTLNPQALHEETIRNENAFNDEMAELLVSGTTPADLSNNTTTDDALSMLWSTIKKDTTILIEFRVIFIKLSLFCRKMSYDKFPMLSKTIESVKKQENQKINEEDLWKPTSFLKTFLRVEKHKQDNMEQVIKALIKEINIIKKTDLPMESQVPDNLTTAKASTIVRNVELMQAFKGIEEAVESYGKLVARRECPLVYDLSIWYLRFIQYDEEMLSIMYANKSTRTPEQAEKYEQIIRVFKEKELIVFVDLDNYRSFFRDSYTPPDPDNKIFIWSIIQKDQHVDFRDLHYFNKDTYLSRTTTSQKQASDNIIITLICMLEEEGVDTDFAIVSDDRDFESFMNSSKNDRCLLFPSLKNFIQQGITSLLLKALKMDPQNVVKNFQNYFPNLICRDSDLNNHLKQIDKRNCKCIKMAEDQQNIKCLLTFIKATVKFKVLNRAKTLENCVNILRNINTPQEREQDTIEPTQVVQAGPIKEFRIYIENIAVLLLKSA